MSDATKSQRRGNVKTCPKCKREVGLNGKALCTHGPGPAGEFVCPGSGDKGMVKAGKFKA